MSDETECPTACLDHMYATANRPDSPMAGLPGAIAVSEHEPEVVAVEFPPRRYLCPHGSLLIAYPTPERIAALRVLNQEDDR